MKKLTQLVSLIALLALCFVPVSGISADEKGGGSLILDGKANGLQEEGDWTIICADGETTECTGSYDYCRGYCDGYCGGGPGSCS